MGRGFLPKYDEITEENVWNIIKEEIGQVFVKVLEDAGVYNAQKKAESSLTALLQSYNSIILSREDL